jgi:hypothetical protein
MKCSGWCRRYVAIFFIWVLVPLWFALAVHASDQVEEIFPPRLAPAGTMGPQLQGADSSEAGDRAESNPSVYVPWSNMVFQVWIDGNWEIYLGLENSYLDSERVTYEPAADIEPRLNRGATRITFASNRDGDYEIYVMNRDGTGLVQLTKNGTNDVNPTWSPDGAQIAFESYRDEQAEVYVMNADGTNQRPVTSDPDYDGFPAWSPDGSRIAFVSRRTGGYRIYAMNPDGSNVVQLSTQPYSLDPAWSPDGTSLLYDADQDGNGWQEMWLMDADGSHQGRIYDPGNQRDALARSWSPDGDFMAFTYVTYEWHGSTWVWTRTEMRGLMVNGGGYTQLASGIAAWYPGWETTDGDRPQSSVSTLPAYSPWQDFVLIWSGTDVGCGLWNYDVQYRAGTSGIWVDWQTATSATSAQYPAEPGTTIYFRSRARDYSYNVEPWPVKGDTWTTFYSWQLAGRITDNRGVPLSDVPIDIAPQPLDAVKTDVEGQYLARLVATGAHNVTVARPAYAPLPTTSVHMENLEAYLPPEDNVVQNGSFEASSHSLDDWGVSGTLPIALAADARHTGDYGLRFGLDCPYPCLSTFENMAWAELLEADMDTDSQGNLHVAWQGQRPGQARSTYYSLRSVDGAWSLPYEVVSEWDVSPPLLAVDRQDVVHYFWGQEQGIYWRKRLPSGTWTQPILIAANPDNPSLRETVVDDQNQIHLLFSTGWGLYYMQGTPDGAWTAPEQVSSSGRDAAMALGVDGDLHVAWASGSVIVYRVRLRDGLWTPAQPLFAEQDYFVPQVYGIVVTANGTVHLFFHQNYTYDAIRSPQGQWSVPEPLPQTWSEVPGDVAVDSEGDVHFINIDRSTSHQGVYYRVWSPELGWQPTIVLDASYPYYRPAVAVDNHDVVHLLWTNSFQGVSYATNQAATSAGAMALYQPVVIPVDMVSPTLSFMERRSRDLPGDASGVELLIDDGLAVTPVLTNSGEARWSQRWVDLQTWSGQAVTITYRLHQVTGTLPIEVAVDDFSLGSAYPDLWVTAAGSTGRAAPGEMVVYVIHYGNQSSITTRVSVLTVELPDQVTLDDVDPAPSSFLGPRSLVWDLGDLPAHSGPQTVTITATVEATASTFTTATTSASISAAGLEIEQANNHAQALLFISYAAHLPVVWRAMNGSY